MDENGNDMTGGGSYYSLMSDDKARYTRDSEGRNELMRHVIAGNLQWVEDWLHHYADGHDFRGNPCPDAVTVADNKGWTPLMRAAAMNRQDLAEALVRRMQSNINQTDKSGSTALHHAAWAGHADMVRYLVKAKANKGAQNNQGQTPSQVASVRGHGEVVKAL